MTLFGAIYYDTIFYNKIHYSNSIVLDIIEILFVFFPFVTLRKLFPTTHFRDALFNNRQNKSVSINNKTFYYYGIYIIKIFYMIAKHYMGNFIMYIRYLNVINSDLMFYMEMMSLCNIGTISISVFLHTLRFKQILYPRISLLYLCYYGLYAIYTLVHYII